MLLLFTALGIVGLVVVGLIRPALPAFDAWLEAKTEEAEVELNKARRCSRVEVRSNGVI